MSRYTDSDPHGVGRPRFFRKLCSNTGVGICEGCGRGCCGWSSRCHAATMVILMLPGVQSSPAESGYPVTGTGVCEGCGGGCGGHCPQNSGCAGNGSHAQVPSCCCCLIATSLPAASAASAVTWASVEPPRACCFELEKKKGRAHRLTYSNDVQMLLFPCSGLPSWGVCLCLRADPYECQQCCLASASQRALPGQQPY